MTAPPQDEDSRSDSTADPVAGEGSSAHPPKTPDSAPPAEDAAGQSPAGPASLADDEVASGAASPADTDGSEGRAPRAENPASDQAEAEEEARDAAPVEKDFEALLADTKRERDEYLELAKRTKADFENYRKRMSAEAQAAILRGKAELVRQVVPVLDDLERALEAAGLDPEGDSPEGLEHGVLLVFRSLRETLARNGIEAVDPRGEKFDPNLHEALSTQPSDGAETGTIVEVLQKGYRLEGQLIRPARVVVAE